MPLNPGDRIGQYEVVSPLGKGGMGEVYRARDTKLERDVALKILSDQFTADPDRLVRFEREARVLASLNHPNIAQVYGLEGDGPVSPAGEARAAGSRPPVALVMELVEGEELKELIERGPLPLEEALAVARQIADALEAAHDAGTVHRDLKPANVKVRDDGTVKVLDFGLAKVFDPVGEASPDAANSPTLTARATQLGMILGTAAYMAPEQAKGKSVDKRADTFAFGAVLYEMLTGRRAFDGDDVSDVMASVLKSEPAYDALPAGTPAALRRFLKRCLEKDPRHRLRDIGEGMRQLDEALAAPAPAPTGVDAAPAVAPTPLWRRLLAIAAIVAVTAIAGSTLWQRRPPEPAPQGLMRFAAAADLGFSNTGREIAVSPDGRQIIYFGSSNAQLYVRAIDELEATALRGADLATSPFVSPDNEWVGFTNIVSTSSLLKVSMFGGPKTLIAESPSPIFGADWGADDVIVFGTNAGLFRVPGGGGEPEALTTAGSGELGHFWPSIVPGARVVLFVVSTQASLETKSLAVLDMETGAVTALGIAGTNPKYLPSGHIAYVTEDSALRAIPFDLDTLTVVGNPVPLVDGVQAKAAGAANFDVSDDGMLVYVSGPAGGASRNTLAWVDRSGAETAIAAQTRAYFYPRLSPDGSQAAIDVRDQDNDIWVWDFALETLRRLTFSGSTDQYPLWTPDSGRIVFGSNRDGPSNVYVQNADGTGTVERIVVAERNQWPNAMVPDGSAVIVRASGNGDDLVRIPLDGGDPEPLFATEFNELNAALSPDGRWLAFQSNASGDMQVFVRPFPDVDAGSWQVSTNGGIYPLWSPNSRELFYLDPDDIMMSVPVEIDPTFAHRSPQRLFDASGYFFGAPGRNFDIAPDGRFLMVKPPARSSDDEISPAGITVVLNWLEDVRARVPKR